jgi:CheY-like chemotaxis protein
MAAVKKTILVVDDDPDIVETTKTILEKAGYKIETASNGTEGLAKARDMKPDLMLLDIMMDKETEGFHVAYDLRSDEKTRDIKILVLTNVGRKSGFKFAPETDEDYLPVDGFLEKPLEPKTLVATVKEVLGEKQGK